MDHSKATQGRGEAHRTWSVIFGVVAAASIYVLPGLEFLDTPEWWEWDLFFFGRFLLAPAAGIAGLVLWVKSRKRRSSDGTLAWRLLVEWGIGGAVVVLFPMYCWQIFAGATYVGLAGFVAFGAGRCFLSGSRESFWQRYLEWLGGGLRARKTIT